jgi:hypothetical protein
MKTVYLIGSIDMHEDPETALAWRRVAREKLEAAGFRVTDPPIGEASAGWTPMQVYQDCRFKVEEADIVLCEMLHPVPSIGTSVELEWAYQWGKEIVVWGDAYAQSKFMQVYAPKRHHELEDALRHITQHTTQR